MQRDHRLRPSFSDLVQELRELSRLQQQGVDMETYAKPVTLVIPPANKWRSLSLGARLARPSMPQASCSSFQHIFTEMLCNIFTSAKMS